MKKLKIKVLKPIYQDTTLIAEPEETIEVIEATEQTTSIIDKEGMTRKLKSNINYLIKTGLIEIKTFKF